MPSISDFIDAGAGTNPIGAAASLLTGGNPLESAGTIFNDIVGGIFGGHTGASGVHFKNDRNTGTSSWWFGKFANMKWRDCDAILKAYNGGGGLKSFGWDGGTPRSAQGIFKRAEDRFFEIFPTYLKDVADGRIELAPSLQEADDLDVNIVFSNL